MKKYLFILMFCVPIYAADNEIFIDQSSGASNSNIDLEQLFNQLMMLLQEWS